MTSKVTVFTLSEGRRRLLQRNCGRIRALVKPFSYGGERCHYEYDDGTICVASAALSEDERANLNNFDTYQSRVLNRKSHCDKELKNDTRIDSLARKNILSLHPSDEECLSRIQDMHDAVFIECNNRTLEDMDVNGRQSYLNVYDRFLSALESLIKTGAFSYEY